MTIVDVITVIIICVLLVILLALMAFVLIDFLKSREGRRMVRTMKDVCSTILACMSPSTPLQKEIKEEERTIREIEQQKRDIEYLNSLKQKRDQLFEEFGDADFKARVYTPEQTERILNGKCSKEKYRLRYNGIEINKLFATEEEAFAYAEAASDNNYFEAEVRRIN